MTTWGQCPTCLSTTAAAAAMWVWQQLWLPPQPWPRRGQRQHLAASNVVVCRWPAPLTVIALAQPQGTLASGLWHRQVGGRGAESPLGHNAARCAYNAPIQFHRCQNDVGSLKQLPSLQVLSVLQHVDTAPDPGCSSTVALAVTWLPQQRHPALSSSVSCSALSGTSACIGSASPETCWWCASSLQPWTPLSMQ